MLTRDSHGHITGIAPAPRTCAWCGAPLGDRTRRARYCAGTLCARHHRKALRRIEALRRCPNCLVCGERMLPKPSRRLDARTCSAKCSRKAWHWFGTMAS